MEVESGMNNGMGQSGQPLQSKETEMDVSIWSEDVED